MIQGTATETCANCGAVIGRLEAAMVWKNNTVCGACYARLRPGGSISYDSPTVDEPVIPYARTLPKKRKQTTPAVLWGMIATLVVGGGAVLYLSYMIWGPGPFESTAGVLVIAAVIVALIAIGVRLGTRQ